MKGTLIVEHNRHLRESYRIALKDQGSETHALSSGKEALKFFEHKNNVDPIVIDTKMDDFKNFTMLEKLLVARENSKIVLNSAYAIYKHDKLTWLTHVFLTKPFSTSELRNTVNVLLTA